MDSSGFLYSCSPRLLHTSKDGIDYLGEGSYGKVYKVYSPKLGVCAVKIVQMTGTRDRQNEISNIIQIEAKILAAINHEHIVRFHGVSCWSHYFAIIMDYAPAGSLHQLLKNKNVEIIPWNLRLRMISETSKAIAYLHNSGIDDRTVHGDLKSCNILLSDDLRIRVADFGAAEIATKTCDRTSYEPPANARIHTVVFSAPEFLNDVFAVKAKAMDVFSFGRVVYEVITRRTPFETQEFSNMTDAIIGGEKPSEDILPTTRQHLIDKPNGDLLIFDELVNLMHRCSCHEPPHRPMIVAVNKQLTELMKSYPPVLVFQSVLTVINQMHIRDIESPVSARKPLQSLVF